MIRDIFNLATLHKLLISLTSVVSGFGYLGIVILMFLESSFFPFPSEIIMIPAGYLAAIGNMNIILVIFFGIFGSLTGAVFNYYLGYRLGKPFLVKYGRYMLIKKETLDKMDALFDIHGEIITFVGRLLPGVRQYISLPAGISKMAFPKFVLYTSLGAGIWVTILSLLGYFVGQNQHLIHIYLSKITYSILVFSVIVAVYYIAKYKLKQKQHIQS